MGNRGLGSIIKGFYSGLDVPCHGALEKRVKNPEAPAQIPTGIHNMESLLVDSVVGVYII